MAGDEMGEVDGKPLLLISACMGQVWIALVVSGRLERLEVEGTRKLTGNVYKGVIERLAPAIDAAFVKLSENLYGFLQTSDIAPYSIGIEMPSYTKRISIESLKPGNTILVQVLHEPRGQKCPRLTTRISLRGRFVELLAQGADHVAISRTITSARERDRLFRVAEKHRPLDSGIHVHLEAVGKSEMEIAEDIAELVKTWREIVRKYESEPAPSLLYRGASLIERILFSTARDVGEIIVDSPEDYEHMLHIAAKRLPHIAPRIKLYDSPIPLFDAYGITEQIERALSKRVKLPSGAYIVIETTEALTSIDVNTGHVIVGDSHEALLQINMEAAEELARQLRIRNIGGLIAVDFVDMPSPHSWVKLQEHLQHQLNLDEAETRIVTLSPMGVVEITRQRRGLSLEEILMEQCKCCGGSGKVLSASALALQLRRELLLKSNLHPAGIEAAVCAHPEVIAALLEAGEDELRRLEAMSRRKIWLFACDTFARDQFEIAFGDESLSKYLKEQPDEGEQFEVLEEKLYPKEIPVFALFKNKLVRLPQVDTDKIIGISLKLTKTERWFAESAWVPSVRTADVARSESDALKLKMEGGERR